MLFLPYGNDAGPVRFPWITTTIVVVCLAVHTFTWLKDSEREELLIQLKLREQRLEAVDRMAGRHLQGFDQALKEAGIIEKDDESVTDSVRRALAQIRERKKALEAEMILPRYGLVPGRGGPWWTYVSHAFLHAGWFHVLGNLWFLWLCAVNLEHCFGRLRLIFLYGAGVAGAGLFFSLWHPSFMEPAVGASGAVSAMIGGFLVAFHRARIRIFWFAMWFVGPRWGTFAMPAWAAIPFWLGTQLLGAAMEASISMGVAYSAHLGGFAVGLVIAALYEVSRGEEPENLTVQYAPSSKPVERAVAPARRTTPPVEGATSGAQPASAYALPPGAGSLEGPAAAARDPRTQIVPFLKRFPEADPVRHEHIEAFLSWRKERPGHMLTQAYVTMYVNSLTSPSPSESHETRSLLIAFVDYVAKYQGQRLHTTTGSLSRLPPPPEPDSNVTGKMIGAVVVLVFLGVGGHFWGRIGASRDCSRFERALGDQRDLLIDNTKTHADIIERVRALALEWKIEPEPENVDVQLEELTFVTLTKLPGDEMFALGVGSGQGPNPNAVLTIAVDAPAPRFMATAQCQFERVMRVITAGKVTPISDPANAQ